MDCNTSVVKETVRNVGYALFKGFNPTQEDFENFTNQFGTCAKTRQVHYPATGEGLGFHSEDAYNPYRPDVIWFFCAYQGSDGGIPTGIVDGVEIFNQLPNRWKSFCRTKKLKFSRQWESSVWLTQKCSYGQEAIQSALESIPGMEYEFMVDGSIYLGYETPLITKTVNGQECFANTMLQAVSDPEFYGMSLEDEKQGPTELIAIAEEIALAAEQKLGWRTGEVAIIDNLRMMHRRSAYRQVDRDIRVRHGENFFGSQLPEDHSPLGEWVKSFIQADIALPTRVGSPSSMLHNRKAS